MGGMSLLLVVLALGGTVSAETGDLSDNGPTVLAVVNGDTITAADLDELLVSSHRQIAVDKRQDFDYRMLLTKLINDRLIVQEALAMEMDQEESVSKKVETYRSQTAISDFLNDIYQPTVKVTDEKILEKFEKNYRRAQLRTLGVTDPDLARELALLIESGASMDSLARLHSQDSQRDKGGMHKPRYWKDIPNILREQAIGLEVGQLKGPFPYEDSFMLLRIESIEPANREALAHTEEIIRKAIIRDAQAATWSALMDSLNGNYVISVDQDVLERIQADSSVFFTGGFLNSSEVPVMTVNGNTVATEGSFRSELSHRAMTAGDLPLHELCELVVSELSEKFVLEAASQDNGYLERPELDARVTKLRDSLLIEMYLVENIVEQMRYSRDEYSQIYEEHKEEWRDSGEVKVDVMLLPDIETADRALTMLRDGADFDYVTGLLGIESQYDSGNENWRPLAGLPNDLAGQLATIAVGGFTDGHYELMDGWAIFRLNDRKAGRVPSIEEVDKGIRAILFQRNFNRMMNQLIETLKVNSAIEMFEDRIARYLEGSN